MKTLYISYDGATDPLGRAQIIPYLIGLSKKGANITILTFEKKERSSEISELNSYLETNGISWKRLWYHKRPKTLATLLDVCVGVVVGYYLIKKTGIEIVHGRTFFGSLIGTVLRKITNIKLLVDVRGLWADERAEGGSWEKGGLNFRVFKYLENLAIRNADGMVVLTERLKEHITASDINKKKNIPINVVPTCVDIDKFNDNIRNQDNFEAFGDKFVLVYLGSLGTVYLLDEMLRFFRIFNEYKEDAVFLIISHSDVSSLPDKLREADVEINRVFIKSVNHDDVAAWLSCASAGIAFYKPYFSAIGRAPTKMGEYLACGVPIVINKGIGDSDRVVVDSNVGIMIDNFSEVNLRKGAMDLIKFTENNGDIKDRCRKTAKKYFNLSNGVEIYWDLYNRLYN